MKLVLFLLINIFGGLFQGIVGFGQGLIVSPLSLTILSKGTVLTALMVAGACLCLFLIRQVKEPLNKEISTPLVLWSIVGMPLGIVILKVMPLDALRVYVGSLSIVFTLAILFIKFKTHHLRRLTPLIGFISGVLQTSTGLAGPPVVLLLSGSGIPKNSMRKILVFFFFWESVLAIPVFFVSRVLTLQGIFFGLCVVPFAIAAGYVGNKVSHKIPQTYYRALALITVCLTGAYAIYSGLQH